MTNCGFKTTHSNDIVAAKGRWPYWVPGYQNIISFLKFDLTSADSGLLHDFSQLLFLSVNIPANSQQGYYFSSPTGLWEGTPVLLVAGTAHLSYLALQGCSYLLGYGCNRVKEVTQLSDIFKKNPAIFFFLKKVYLLEWKYCVYVCKGGISPL